MITSMRAQTAGISGTFELALRFAEWATRLRRTPTWQEVSDRWGVSRATAFRWLAAWNDATGAAPPPPPPALWREVARVHGISKRAAECRAERARRRVREELGLPA